MKRLVVVIITGTMFALFLSGCGVAYNVKRSQMLKTATEADYGPPPPTNHQELEMQLIRANLKDPDSAKCEFGGVTRDAIQSGFASPTPILVWRTSVRVNAKNSYGGYTGFQPYHFAWRDGRVVAVAFPTVSAYGVSDGYWQYLK